MMAMVSFPSILGADPTPRMERAKLIMCTKRDQLPTLPTTKSARG